MMLKKIILLFAYLGYCEAYGAAALPSTQKTSADQVAEFIMFAASDIKDQVQALMKSGVNPNSQDENGMTPLMAAAGNGHLELVKLLLDAGANPNLKIDKNFYPFGNRFLNRGWAAIDLVNYQIDHAKDPAKIKEYQQIKKLLEDYSKKFKSNSPLLEGRIVSGDFPPAARAPGFVYKWVEYIDVLEDKVTNYEVLLDDKILRCQQQEKTKHITCAVSNAVSIFAPDKAIKDIPTALSSEENASTLEILQKLIEDQNKQLAIPIGKSDQKS